MDRARWSDDELTEAVQSASAHVRFLLKELSQSDHVPARELKSKRVAYAIVQRICNSANKDSLVLADVNGGEKTYHLHPDYRDKVVPLVRDAPVPPPTPVRPRRPKSNGMGRGRRGMSATDGIADPTGGLGASGMRMRRITQNASGRFLAFPEGVSLEFCQDLMGFLNSNAGSIRYRVVLDAEGPRLEIA